MYINVPHDFPARLELECFFCKSLKRVGFRIRRDDFFYNMAAERCACVPINLSVGAHVFATKGGKVTVKTFEGQLILHVNKPF